MKYLFSICLFVFAFNLNAQKIFTFAGSDTIINTGTVNITLTVSQWYETGLFQLVNTKVSGTVGGKTYFQGSVDNVNFVNLDSLTNTNVTTNTKIFEDSPPTYPYYRFRYTGTGTMSAIMSAKAHFKRP